MRKIILTVRPSRSPCPSCAVIDAAQSGGCKPGGCDPAARNERAIRRSAVAADRPRIGRRLTAGIDSARRRQDTRNPAADSNAEADARPDALAQRERDPYGDQGHDGIRARWPATRARTRRLQLPSRPHAPPGMVLGRCAGVHYGRFRVGHQLGEWPPDQEQPRPTTTQSVSQPRRSAHDPRLDRSRDGC